MIRDLFGKVRKREVRAVGLRCEQSSDSEQSHRGDHRSPLDTGILHKDRQHSHYARGENKRPEQTGITHFVPRVAGNLDRGHRG